MDPLDGSSNFFASFPYYGSSIALKKDEKVIASFIVNLSNAQYFCRGEKIGKWHGKLFENKTKKDFGFFDGKIGIFEKAYQNWEIVKELEKLNIKFRSPGAVALSMAYSHWIEYMLFVGKVREFDIAAGIYLCKELNIFRNNSIVLISKNKDTFVKIKELVLKG